MSTTPVASVVIPTKNRRDLLRSAIASVLRQSTPVEVLVLDDGSTDGSAAMVRSEFPDVRVLRSETSRGPTWQRNVGARAATAPFLVTLDDDCELVSPRTLAQCLAEFETPRVAAVTIPYINIRQDQVTRSRSPGPGVRVTLTFLGGMVAFRRDVFLAAGGYRPEYFMHVEESDLALRFLAAGHVVRLGTADPLHHHESPVRDLRRMYVLGARNHVLFTWFNVPLPFLLPHLGMTTAKHLLFGARHRQLRLVAQGLARGYLGAAIDWRGRAAVPPGAYLAARKLKCREGLPLDEVERYLPDPREPSPAPTSGST